MFRTDSIELNNGNIIDITSSDVYTNLTYHESTMFCYPEGAVKPCTVISTIDFYNEAITKSEITASTWANFIQWRNDAGLADENYIALKTFIENNTVWIWGSLEEGGCFYFNGGVTGKCGIGACYGFVHQAADESFKRYECTTQVNGFTLTEAGEVAFGYDTISAVDAVPKLHIWYINQGYRDESIQNDSPFFGDYSSLTDSYNYTLTVMLSAMLGVTTWVHPPLLTYWVPSRVWNNQSRDPSLIRKTLYTTLNQNNIIYGSITGNSNIDPQDNPSYQGGLTEPEGGDGDYPDRSDEVDFSDPDDMTVDAVNSGFITLYNPSKAEVKAFSDYLWTSITDQLSQQIKRIIANPLDAVLFVSMCHFDPPTTGTSQIIKYCGLSTGVSANLIDKQYMSLDCGEIDVVESCKNFLDYNPYSKASIYLPYAGVQTIDVNDVMRSTVAVKYLIDMMSGSAIAQVKCTRAKRRDGDADLDAVLYEFPCNVYEQLPLSASDWRAAISNMTSLVSGAVGVATGNGAGLGAMASAVASQQVSVVRSGNISGNYGYVGHQKPYLILERPIENMPVDFPTYEGFTANIKYKLSNLSGYTEIDGDSWKSERVLGFEEEMKEIKQLLESGVYI